MPNLFSLLKGNRFCCARFTTVLVCLDHVSLLVMWTPRNLKLNLLHCSPVDENRGVLGPLFSVVHKHLLCLAQVQGEVIVLAPPSQVSDLLPIGGLVIVGDQACCEAPTDVSSAKLMMVLESSLAMQSWVNREYRRGLSTHPWGAPVLRISMADISLPTLTTWWRPVRKYRIQFQRKVFSPRILSLVMSFECTMVLNAEL